MDIKNMVVEVYLASTIVVNLENSESKLSRREKER